MPSPNFASAFTVSSFLWIFRSGKEEEEEEGTAHFNIHKWVSSGASGMTKKKEIFFSPAGIRTNVSNVQLP